MDSAPIVYGLMDYETFLQNPGIVPGGCCVRPEDRKCRRCATMFRSDGIAGNDLREELPVWLLDD